MPDNILSISKLRSLILAIGQEGFGQSLLASLQALGDVHHCMAAVRGGPAAPRIRISAGAMSATMAARLIREYESGLYSEDPGQPSGHGDGHDPSEWIRPGVDAPAGVVLRDAWRDCGVSDVMMLRGGFDGGGFTLQMFKLDSGQFLEGQRWLLEQAGEVVAASVSKHISNLRMSGVGRSYVIGRIVHSPRFADISERERTVCVGILTGYTSENLALSLGISRNSVLTYRKRLYEKLKISSQSELFVMVMKAANALSIEDELDRDGQGGWRLDAPDSPKV